MSKLHLFFLGLLLSTSGGLLAAPQQVGAPEAVKPVAAQQLMPGARRAYAELLKMRLDPARNLLRSELQRAPNSASTLLVADCIDFADLLATQDADRYDAIIEAQDDRLDALDDSPERGALRDYTIAEIHFHKAIAQVFFNHEVQGAWSMRQAYQQMQGVVKRYPDFLPARKTLGMCQFMIGSLPEGFRWFLKVMGLPGSIEGGMKNLGLAAQQPNDFQTEAQILQALLQESYFKKTEATVQLATRLAAEQPDNLLFSYLTISANKKLRRTAKGLEAYHKRPTGPGYVKLPYLRHIAADLLLYQGQYAASRRENQLFLQEYQGEHFRKDALFKLYLASWLSGDQASANEYRRRIDNDGRIVMEEDAYAQRFYEGKFTLNRTLTRARLQLDGGFYREALTTLNSIPDCVCPNVPLRDKLEEVYFRARAFHGLVRLDSARHCYARTIALSGNAPYYFAPQAALQLGYLFKADGKLNIARTYFEKTLNYPKHEYKNSTDAKAKVALAALNQPESSGKRRL
ncbi:DUF3808 domain-containing protein [Hymenobacter sp. BT175]|uniref:DUF3808 domain-containing protein n=1 Tax=Hymenobacter translucens TaxID=2886507 RepID=UPI001D0E2842|nr:DUF3808 domain-containing protein [Hymenobacter translucens]MCC2546282.1 DUF3808 domain-containing protein [Hymenobacter translucens]